LDVDTDHHRLSYHVVNSVNGRLSVGPDTLEFEEETTTLVGTTGVHAEMEALIEVVLRSHPRWSRAGEQLSISDRAGNQLTFARV